MRIPKLTQNSYLLFAPFLIIFIVFVIVFRGRITEGDQMGYLFFANNLLHGFYSPPAPDINLWWGPGYPILLMPFVFFKVPQAGILILNAVLQYLSIVFLFKALVKMIPFSKAMIFSLFWALCYSSYNYMASIVTESLTVFLLSLLIYSLVMTFTRNSNKFMVLSGFILGYLALTKVIFGYVILVMLLFYVLMWIIQKTTPQSRRSVILLVIAMLVTSPYLIYTFQLTGRIFYWGNSGGMSLYWMSSPYENEYGAWDNEKFTANQIDFADPGINQLLKLNHQNDIDEFTKFKGVQKDDAYRSKAIQNIKAYPFKYVRNIYANISRMLFGFPGNYAYQRPLMKIWYSSVLFTLMLFSFILSLIHWKKLHFIIHFLAVFALIYLGGTSLLGVGTRQFIIIIPALLFWIAYVMDITVVFNFRFRKDE